MLPVKSRRLPPTTTLLLASPQLSEYAIKFHQSLDLPILEGTPVKQDFVSCTFLVRNDSDASLRMTGFSESETVYQWRTQSTIEAVKNVSQALPQKRLRSTTELIFCLWATRLLIIMQRRFGKMVESISYRRSGFMG